MGFYASSFVFANQASEYYDLMIFNFGSGGKQNSSAGGDIEIVNKEVFRRPVPYFYGVTHKPVLTFPLVFGSKNALDSNTREAIHKWLFGQMNYQKLEIVQMDMMDAYYNCFLTNPQIVDIGNLKYAFEATVVCDAPWAWSYDKTLTKTYTEDVVNDDFIFINDSANADYLYPEISFTLNGLGDGITITNYSDNNRQFIFTELSPNETITIDNDRQILTSDTGLYRLSSFNLNWFRILQGTNSLNISGGITSFQMDYKLARNIGG